MRNSLIAGCLANMSTGRFPPIKEYRDLPGRRLGLNRLSVPMKSASLRILRVLAD